MLLAALSGCATRSPVSDEFTRARIAFLVDGRTSRYEILSRLGPPMNSYEDGRIITYSVRETEERFEVGRFDPDSKFSAVSYSLVLVIGSDEVLARHAMVRLN